MSPAVIAEWQAAEAEPDEGDGDRRRARQKVVEGLGGEWLPREDEHGRRYWTNSKTRATTYVDPKLFMGEDAGAAEACPAAALLKRVLRRFGSGSWDGARGRGKGWGVAPKSSGLLGA